MEEEWFTAGYLSISNFGRFKAGDTLVDMTGSSNIRIFSRKIAKHFRPNEWFDKCEVHHIDENPFNNHIDNLMIMTKEAHTAYHAAHRSEKSKQAFRDKMKGRTPWNKGTPRSEEHKKTAYSIPKGSIPWNKGGHISKESIEKRTATRAKNKLAKES